jgi:ubiquinone/menaquinone biosynthesis C-methylase UbiE
LTGQHSAERRLGDFADVDKADASNLVDRLDAMHALGAFQQYKSTTFDLLRPRPGMALADFGCGTGDDANRMAERVAPGGAVTGFDVSEAMLAQARERHGRTPGLGFARLVGPGIDAPSDRFDGIRADRVLIHVPDPRRTLQEMIRVTKHGGRIVISEPDMPGCWVASDHYDIADRIMGQIAKSCAHPYFARDLYAAFKDAGLQDISFQIWPVTAFDLASVARILDLEGVVRGMYSKGLLTQKEVNDVTEDLMSRGREGRFVASVSVMIAGATKA